MRENKNILVTGGAGFIGTHFIHYFLEKKPNFHGKIVNLDLLTYAGKKENLACFENDLRYQFVHGDISSQTLVDHLVLEYEIDTIIHFAAESHVDRSIQGPEVFINTNIKGTYHLLEVVRKYPQIHFHHVSTDEVYGSLGKTGFFKEDSPYLPNSPYSASKAASDHLVYAYHKTYDLSTCISHASNNFGPYQFPEKLIPLVISSALQKKRVPIYGKGEQVRDWLYVEDHVEALSLLLEKGKKGEVYNIGGAKEKTNLSLVREILLHLSSLTETPYHELLSLITFVQDRPAHDFRYALDCTKMRHEFSWKAPSSFSSSLKKTIEWYLYHPEWVS